MEQWAEWCKKLNWVEKNVILSAPSQDSQLKKSIFHIYLQDGESSVVICDMSGALESEGSSCAMLNVTTSIDNAMDA